VGLNYLPYSVVGVQGHTVPSVGEMNGPQNLPEWEDYISGLTGKDLFSQTVAANTQGFGRRLVAEGLTMQHVERIMLLFVRQLRATGTKVPGGGAWDLLNMAQTDPVARKGPTMSESEAASLQKTQPGSDEFDDFELEAEFD